LETGPHILKITYMADILDYLLGNPITLFSVVLSVLVLLAGGVFILMQPKLFLIIFKNLGRNLVRTLLTSLAIMVLVFMVTLIWTVVYFLDQITREKSRDFKIIVTERWQLPSQMPLTHADYLNPESPKFILDPGDVGPGDFMTWSFYGGSLDPTKMTRENIVFFFAMNPRHIIPMMDDLQDFDPALVEKLEQNRIGCLIGRERMEALNKRVGEKFKVTSFNYKGVDLEFEIVGELPEGRYNQSAIMNERYFNNELDRYARVHGQKHPLDQKRLNLVWLRVKDRPTFDRVGSLIENSPYFADRPVKCETASSGIGSFLDAYADLLWGMKWLLVPSILGSMSLVMANAISISVRERRPEMAVLKVLGFRPNQVLGLVLGESLLVGGLSGLTSATLTYGFIDWVIGGIKFPIAFFPAFFVPVEALVWGLALGFGTALLGSFLPSWSARSVRVSEVFSKVA
jgi:putative ABC transport system permease protein